MEASSSSPRLLSLTPFRDRESRHILLLHTAALPAHDATPETIASLLSKTFDSLPPTGPLTLVICYAGLASTDAGSTLYGVRGFRYLYENDFIVPPHFRKRLQLIVPLHVSFSTRAHIYMSSFAMQNDEYSKIRYADLLADLEEILGVDSTLLGLENVDFEYDERMRYWVGRQYEHQPDKAPNPEKPLINLEDIYFTADSAAPVAQTENHLSDLAQP